MNNPIGVAVDRSHSPNRLWVVDIGNNRVLGYNSTADIATNIAPPTWCSASPTSSRGRPRAGLNGPLQTRPTPWPATRPLLYPNGVAVDSQGGVYVADASNSRVLKFNDPFGTDAIGDQVFGQTELHQPQSQASRYGTASAPDRRRSGVVRRCRATTCGSADTLNHRVVRFSNAPSQPATGAQRRSDPRPGRVRLVQHASRL